MHYTETRFYDPFLDAEAVRISAFPDRGGEYWMRLAVPPPGKARRLQREWALAVLMDAINAGLEPGQVVTDEPDPSAAG